SDSAKFGSRDRPRYPSRAKRSSRRRRVFGIPQPVSQRYSTRRDRFRFPRRGPECAASATEFSPRSSGRRNGSPLFREFGSRGTRRASPYRLGFPPTPRKRDTIRASCTRGGGSPNSARGGTTDRFEKSFRGLRQEAVSSRTRERSGEIPPVSLRRDGCGSPSRDREREGVSGSRESPDRGKT